MENATRERRAVGRKKQPKEDGPKRYGTQIRVSDAFADLIVKLANMEGVSVADLLDKHVLGVMEKRYRDAIVREARRLEGGEK
jgi:hypothetical protein